MDRPCMGQLLWSVRHREVANIRNRSEHENKNQGRYSTTTEII